MCQAKEEGPSIIAVPVECRGGTGDTKLPLQTIGTAILEIALQLSPRSGYVVCDSLWLTVCTLSAPIDQMSSA